MPKIRSDLKEYNYYLGIDPGQSGAVSIVLDRSVLITPNQKLLCLPFKDKTEHEISYWFEVLLTAYPRDRIRAAIEKVHSMPGQGVSSSFKFGMSYGFLRGLVVAHKIPFVEVPPQRWQKELNCLSKGDKNVTKAAAHKKWPMVADQIKHSNADSMLIAEWLRLQDVNGKL